MADLRLPGNQKKVAHICILPRNGIRLEDAVWIETDPSFVFHYMNAYEENGSIS